MLILSVCVHAYTHTHIDVFPTQVSITAKLLFILVEWDIAETGIWKWLGRQKMKYIWKDHIVLCLMLSCFFFLHNFLSREIIYPLQHHNSQTITIHTIYSWLLDEVFAFIWLFNNSFGQLWVRLYVYFFCF